MQVLPLQPGASYQLATELSGTPLVIGVRWNATSACYLMAVADYDGNRLVPWQALRLGLQSMPDKAVGFPDGVFAVVDTSGAGAEATYDDLGSRVLVYWFPASDTPQITDSELNGTPQLIEVGP